MRSANNKGLGTLPSEHGFTAFSQAREKLRAAREKSSVRAENVLDTLRTQSPFSQSDASLLTRWSDSLRHLGRENDPEIFETGLLQFAIRCQKDGHEAQAALVFQYLSAPETGDKTRRAAVQELRALNGQGSSGRRAEVLLRHFASEATDAKNVVPMLAGSVVGQMAKSWAFSRFALAPQAGLLTRGTGAKLLSGAFGMAMEVPAFALSERLLAPKGGASRSWEADLAGSALSLGVFKLSSYLGGKLPLSFLAAPLSSFAGLMAAHQVEMRFGLKPKTDDATAVTDALVSLAGMSVGAHLGQRVLGPGWGHFQAELALRASHRETGPPGEMNILAEPLVAGRIPKTKSETTLQLGSPDLLATGGGSGRRPGAAYWDVFGILKKLKPDLDNSFAGLDWLDRSERDGEVAASSHRGIGYDEHNEDRFFFAKRPEGEMVLAAIDGLGGHDDGEEAAAIVRAVFTDGLEMNRPVPEILEYAHRVVRAYNLERHAPNAENRHGRFNPGAVVAVVETKQLEDDYHRANFWTVGDAEAVVFRRLPEAGAFQVVHHTTRPPADPFERKQNGEEFSRTADGRLPLEDVFDNRQLYFQPVDSYLGVNDAMIGFHQERLLQTGDVLLVGSDGFFDNFGSFDIIGKVIAERGARTAAEIHEALFHEALIRMSLLEIGLNREITHDLYVLAYRKAIGREPPPDWKGMYEPHTEADGTRKTYRVFYRGILDNATGKVVDVLKGDNLTLLVQVLGHKEIEKKAEKEGSAPLTRKTHPYVPRLANLLLTPLWAFLGAGGIGGGGPLTGQAKGSLDDAEREDLAASLEARMDDPDPGRQLSAWREMAKLFPQLPELDRMRVFTRLTELLNSKDLRREKAAVKLMGNFFPHLDLGGRLTATIFLNQVAAGNSDYRRLRKVAIKNLGKIIPYLEPVLQVQTAALLETIHSKATDGPIGKTAGDVLIEGLKHLSRADRLPFVLREKSNWHKSNRSMKLVAKYLSTLNPEDRLPVLLDMEAIAASHGYLLNPNGWYLIGWRYWKIEHLAGMVDALEEAERRQFYGELEKRMQDPDPDRRQDALETSIWIVGKGKEDASDLVPYLEQALHDSNLNESLRRPLCSAMLRHGFVAGAPRVKALLPLMMSGLLGLDRKVGFYFSRLAAKDQMEILIELGNSLVKTDPGKERDALKSLIGSFLGIASPKDLKAKHGFRTAVEKRLADRLRRASEAEREAVVEILVAMPFFLNSHTLAGRMVSIMKSTATREAKDAAAAVISAMMSHRKEFRPDCEDMARLMAEIMESGEQDTARAALDVIKNILMHQPDSLEIFHYFREALFHYEARVRDYAVLLTIPVLHCISPQFHLGLALAVEQRLQDEDFFVRAHARDVMAGMKKKGLMPGSPDSSEAVLPPFAALGGLFHGAFDALRMTQPISFTFDPDVILQNAAYGAAGGLIGLAVFLGIRGAKRLFKAKIAGQKENVSEEPAPHKFQRRENLLKIARGAIKARGGDAKDLELYEYLLNQFTPGGWLPPDTDRNQPKGTKAKILAVDGLQNLFPWLNNDPAFKIFVFENNGTIARIDLRPTLGREEEERKMKKEFPKRLKRLEGLVLWDEPYKNKN